MLNETMGMHLNMVRSTVECTVVLCCNNIVTFTELAHAVQIIVNASLAKHIFLHAINYFPFPITLHDPLPLS